mmetsp:Transcript_25484/g.36524  ORF Transcript_25484/g.36524 Transcript_25484/m.36524 type:complete len:262 (+) Transcript_25484:1-786(+)
MVTRSYPPSRNNRASEEGMTSLPLKSLRSTFTSSSSHLYRPHYLPSCAYYLREEVPPSVRKHDSNGRYYCTSTTNTLTFEGGLNGRTCLAMAKCKIRQNFAASRSRFTSTTNTQKDTESAISLEEKEVVVSQNDIDIIDAAVSSSEPQQTNDPLASIPGAQKGGKKLAIVYTCGVCETRTAQKFTEQAYLHGVVICRCPGCDNLHLIADRLGYFEDPDGGGWDIQKFLLKEKRGEEFTTVTDDNQLIEIVKNFKSEPETKT